MITVLAWVALAVVVGACCYWTGWGEGWADRGVLSDTAQARWADIYERAEIDEEERRDMAFALFREWYGNHYNYHEEENIQQEAMAESYARADKFLAFDPDEGK